MKKLFIIFLIIVATLTTLLLGLRYMFYPREYNLKLEGVKYKLGTENRDSHEPVTIEIDGKLTRKFKGDRVFEGRINIIGEKIEIPSDNRDITIHFDSKYNSGFMQYKYISIDEEIFKIIYAEIK